MADGGREQVIRFLKRYGDDLDQVQYRAWILKNFSTPSTRSSTLRNGFRQRPGHPSFARSRTSRTARCATKHISRRCSALYAAQSPATMFQSFVIGAHIHLIH